MDETLMREYFAPVLKQSFTWIKGSEKLEFKAYSVHVKTSVFTEFICHEGCGACCLAVVNKPGLNLMEFLPSEKALLEERAASIQEEELTLLHEGRSSSTTYKIYLEDVRKSTPISSPLRVLGEYKYTCKHLGERGQCMIYPNYCMGSQIPPLAGWFNKRTRSYEWQNWPFLGRSKQTKQLIVDEKDIVWRGTKVMGEEISAGFEVVAGQVVARRGEKQADGKVAVKTLYNYTQQDGTYGVLCQQPGTITINSGNSTRRKFKRIKEWTDYLQLETWLPEILEWAGPIDSPLPTSDWHS